MNKVVRLLAKLIVALVVLGLLVLLSVYFTLYPKPYKNFNWDKTKFDQTISPELVDKKDFTILTFNAGFLDLRIHGQTKFMPTHHIQARLADTPAHILPRGADLIAFQEVYEKDHIDFLIRELKAAYPHYYFQHNSRFKVNNGLMLFSKYPLNERKGLSQSEKGPIDELLLADRGLLSAVINVNGKRINIVNLHTTSGGTRYSSDDPIINAMRGRQIEKAIDLSQSKNTDYQIILGDLNAGPAISSENYQSLLENDYIDAHLAYSVQSNSALEATWAGDNYHNSIRGYGGNVQQRIDVVFLSKNLSDAVTLIGAQRLYTENSVKIDDDVSVPLSDHYGVEVSFEFR